MKISAFVWIILQLNNYTAPPIFMFEAAKEIVYFYLIEVSSPYSQQPCHGAAYLSDVMQFTPHYMSDIWGGFH
jgi:hypothetical protein